MNSPTVTKVLLDQGAELELLGDCGRTAIMHFFLGGFISRPISILKSSLLAGADSRASDISGTTVLGHRARLVTETEMANLYPGSNSYNKAFHELVTFGALSQRDVLVEELRALDVPLVVASRLGNAQLCWALLDTGVDPDKHGIVVDSPLGNNCGSVSSELESLAWNPLLIALKANAYVTAAIISAYGADVDFQTPGRKRTKYSKYNSMKCGVTPLHLAVGSDRSDNWYGSIVSLRSDVHYAGYAFSAAGHQNHMGLERSLDARKYYKRRDYNRTNNAETEMEESDPEYEVQRFVYQNDSTGADKVPFDTLFESTFSPKDPCHPLLEDIINKNQRQGSRQVVFVKYILETGKSVNVTSQQGVTPLALAVKQGRLDLTEILLEKGADPNIADRYGCAPLMLAAQRGRQDIVKALLEYGAHPDTQLEGPDPDRCSCGTFMAELFTFHHCDAPVTP
ncbi:hypothetical protein QQS21_008689 [Conoideocrella luteorostrata]|uniref:Ankyrin n=1 Tax=Conoideocrella luteorostrata TaxID=1105319 RepID=A0AAJ0CMS8_9HYPO|nr:hypothetical protein QQS21_008689 [Conoideocrella luteorostrata]